MKKIDVARLKVALGVATSSLRANPLRSILATLGVIIGVAALVAVLSLGDGMERFARTRIESQGYHSVTVQPVESDEIDGIAIRRTSIAQLHPPDALDLQRWLPPGSFVQMRNQGVSTISMAGDTAVRGTRVIGLLDPARGTFQLVDGRWYPAGAHATETNEILVSDSLAVKLGVKDPAHVIGRTVRFGTGVEAVIVGVVTDPQVKVGHAVVAPVSLASTMMIAGRSALLPAALEANAANIEQVGAVRAAVERWVAQRFASDTSAVQVSSLAQSRLEEIQRSVLLFKLFMGAIVGISLVVGGVGIMNVLLASVTERTREIGIRKAAGATDGAILTQFLAESVTITVAGAVLGISLGLLASFGFAGVMRAVSKAPIHAGFTAGSLVVASLVAVLVGLIFGSYPALRAARLSPIDAIRHEA